MQVSDKRRDAAYRVVATTVDFRVPVLLSSEFVFNTYVAMENTRWPYFDPDYETTCSTFNPPRYAGCY